LPLDERTLLVFRYSAAGFVPATIPIQPTEDLSAITFLGERIATQRPIVQQWNTPSPSTVDFMTVASRPAEYSAVRELGIESLYPVIEGYKDSVSFGLHARFSDPVGFDTLVATAGYSPDDNLASKERVHAAVEFRHSLWTFGARWNGADFYDLFGPTKRSREGYSAYVGYERPLIYSPPEEMSLKVDAAYYGDLDSLPAFQNIPSPSDRLFTANIGLEYEYPRASIGWVDDETGHLWGLYTHTYVADGDVIPSLYGKFDIGFALPLGHSSIWLRNAAGVNWGDRDNPLVSAYFGGFRQQLRRQRRSQALSRDLHAAGFRDRCAERQVVRQVDGGVEPAATEVRALGLPGVLRELGPACAVRDGAGDRSRPRGPARGCLQRRLPARRTVAGHAPPAHDAVLRLCVRFRGRRSWRGRIHDLAQGALMIPAGRDAAA
jgi:hypothetical protein